MNGVTRFLSRRDKHHEKRRSKHDRTSKSQPVSTDVYTIFSNEEAKSMGKDEEKKVKTLLQRLQSAGITNLKDAQVQYALSKNPDDLDKAYDLCVLANDSFEGVLKDFDPDVRLLGAINRNMVTCYLDALLFAMFARLDSFEAMLFDNFSDEPRKKLAAVLRLWVNLLRSGQLITVDLTKHLQDALAKCGWEGAAEVCQQDASEAFTFITGTLELPLLTLKMDIYHTGREDKEDDHKFVNERLLEVAIPEQEGDKPITLEDCLEAYFNNRIEVKRYLQRQNTMSSIKSIEKDPEKNESIHIETVELSGSISPVVSTPTSVHPPTPILARPIEGRRRADSIFSERYKNDPKRSSARTPFDEKRHLAEMLNTSSEGRPRAVSLRKEVLMPAWQFFSLIPWYTDNVPKSDAQVAAHFSAQRPVLGVCLKRYLMEPDGAPKRLNTYIDIPLEIGLPHFVTDARMEEEGPLFGNFKLVLQSVVCHRGVSVDSGHYVSLIRANLKPRRGSAAQLDADINPEAWLRFDDLASERVTNVEIKEALKEESPYLLFYQVQPIDEELASRGDPPTYAEAQSAPLTADPSKETLASTNDVMSTDTEGAEWDKVTRDDLIHPDSINSDETAGRSSMSSNRRSSITFEELDSVQNASRGRTAPTTPAEEKAGFLSSSRRNSKAWTNSGNSSSRPSSQSGETRFSLTLSRLTGRGSKDKLQISDAPADMHGIESGNPEEPVIVVHGVKSAEGVEASTSSIKEKHGYSHSLTGNLGALGRSKSKKGKGKEKKRPRSKSRDPADDQRGKNRPDRECVVM